MQEGQAVRSEQAGKGVSELSCSSLVLTKTNDFGLKIPFLVMALGPTGCDQPPLGCPRDPGLLSLQLRVDLAATGSGKS